MSLLSKKILFAMIFSLCLLIICTIIKPASLAVNNGISYFGIFFSTVIPYALSLSCLSYAYYHISTKISQIELRGRLLSRIFLILSGLFIILIATPYSQLSTLHMISGALLFSIQLVLSFWLSIFVFRKWYLITLAFVEFFSGIFLLYYLNLSDGFSLQMQVIYQFSFMTLLILVFNIDKQSNNLHKLI
jgi:hypothetical protein